MARINLAEYPFAYYPPNELTGEPVKADVGSIIGAGASIIGGAMGDSAASDAAAAQQASAAAATAEQRREYDQTRQDLAPGRALYTGATGKLANLLGIDTGQGQNVTNAQAEYDAALAALTKAQSQGGTTTGGHLYGGAAPGGIYQAYLNNQPTNSSAPDLTTYQQRLDAAKSALDQAKNSPTAHSSDFGSLLNNFTLNDLNNDPVYQSGLQFGLNQGTGAIDARARASGSSDSGSVLKELTRYANDYGSTKANDAYNRFNTNRQTNYNFLSGAAGLGQNSTNATVAAGQNMANNVSNNILGAGNARSAGIIGGANSWSNALSGLANQNWGSFGSFGNPNTSLSSSLYSTPGSFASNFTG